MRYVVLLFLMLGFASDTYAQSTDVSAMSEAEQLGTMAGIALACGHREKLKDFELIASRIIANKSETNALEQQALIDYSNAKIRSFRMQKDSPVVDCSEAIASFDEQPIFQCTVMSDGSVKTPDGKWLKARKN